MIDILLATYNSERYLDEQLQSLSAQTYTDWTLIVSDGGSEDRTMEILERYKEKHSPGKIRILPSGGRLSCTENFERLLENSTADYIMFCDHDDRWLPGKISSEMDSMLRTEEKNPCVPVLVFTDLEICSSSCMENAGSWIQRAGLNPDLEKTIPIVLIYPLFSGCTMLFNKILLEKMKPFLHIFPLHDTFTALMNCIFDGLFVFCPGKHILHRTHENLSILSLAGESSLKRRFCILKNREKESALFRKNLTACGTLAAQLPQTVTGEKKQFLKAMSECSDSCFALGFFRLFCLWFGKIPLCYYLPRILFLLSR